MGSSKTFTSSSTIKICMQIKTHPLRIRLDEINDKNFRTQAL